MILAGFEVTEIIYSVGDTVVARASMSNGESIILKYQNTQYPSEDLNARWRHEHSILESLDSKWVVKAKGIERINNNLVLILEDFAPFNLAQAVHNHNLDLVHSLQIAIQLCEALNDVHKHQLVHNDISPKNILVDLKTLKIKLCDFALATRLSSERVHDLSDKEWGTLDYMSPEQTGRTNLKVDYRSDFYALGVTLYELFVGVKPFAFKDPMALLYAHLVRTPEPLHTVNPSIPIQLSNIVLRLLAKSPDDRYQSSFGLQSDLTRCLEELQTTGKVSNFPVAEFDNSERFNISNKLYGRERETKAILTAYERVSRGHSELILVSGSSGTGKTALVDQLHNPIASKRGLFIKGKCGQFTRNQPYAALIQALQPLMQQLANEGNEKLHYWQFILRRALGDNAAVISDLIPGLNDIIGDVPPLQPLPSAESENRFHAVFTHFINALSSSGRPLVMFLDDLQWADVSTLKLLEQQIQPTKGRSLLIIAAYRDNEVNINHPISQVLDDIKRVQGSIQNLRLTDLNLTHVARLISDTLRCRFDETMPLASLCYEKTQGNPFFLNQFLISLYEGGDIAYNREEGAWNWNIQQIQQHQITDNVVDFMVAKLHELTITTQHVLSLASLLGNTFSLRLLAIAHTGDITETARTLWPALQMGVVIPINENYKFSLSPEKLNLTRYRFLHDRVQQAAYTLVEHHSMPELQRRTGQLLLANTSKEEQEDLLFSILELLNQSRHLIIEDSDKTQLVALNIRGSIKAKNASAYTIAIEFLRIAKSLLPEDAWSTEPSNTLFIHRELAETSFLAGQFDEADALYPTTIKSAPDPLAKVSVMLIQATQYLQQARFKEARAVLIHGLELLGSDFPSSEKQAESQLPSLYSAVQQTLYSRPIDGQLSTAEMTDQRYLLEMEIHNALTIVLYHLRQFSTYGVNSCRMLSLSFEHGQCDLTPLAYLTNAWAMSMMGEPYTRCYEISKLSIAFADKRENRYHRVLVYQGFAAFFQHWGEPLHNTSPLLEKAISWGQEGLNLTSAGHAILLDGINKFIQGSTLDTLEKEAHQGLAFLRRTQQPTTENFVNIAILQPTLALQGRTVNPESFDTNDINVSGLFNNDYSTPCMELALYSQAMIRHAFIMDDLAQQQQNIKNLPIIEACLPHSPSLIESTFYTALILIETARERPSDNNENENENETIEHIKGIAEKFEQWASDCSYNYRHKYLLICAGIATLENNHAEAISCYAKAIKAAKETEFILCEAIANEQYARYWQQQQQNQIAGHLIREAHYLYQCWGAVIKCDQLERNWPEISFTLAERKLITSEPLNKPKVPLTTITHQTDTLDLHSLLKAHQLLSEELGLEPLLYKMMEVLLENAGADKGAIILLDESLPIVELIGELNHDSQQLHYQRVAKPLHKVCEANKPLLPDALINHVHKTLETEVLNHPDKDPYFSYSVYFQQHKPKSVISFPVLSQGNLIAVIYLENNLMENTFTCRHTETLKLLSTQLAISLINASLYEQMEAKVAMRTEELRKISMKDGLTNIANRRSFNERLESEWHRGLRSEQSLSLLMIDIDFFKSYNDFYGHLAGDECIKAVAQALSNATQRSLDFTARYGGEEFCILMSESNHSMALNVAEACLSAVRDLALVHDKSDISNIVSISIGLATQTPTSDEQAVSLIAKADEALYHAKRSGRNCIKSWR